ncbi:MAG: response regulator transcription factor [Terriglobales bacterium]
MITPTRIVVADDQMALLDSLAALLETQSDFAVVGEATTTAETLAIVHREDPDVLLLNLGTPNARGFEMLRALDRSGSQVASVLVSDSMSQLDYVQAVKLGARGLVLEKDGAYQLFSVIRTVAGGELAFPNEIANHVIHAMAKEARERSGTLGRLSLRERQIVTLVARGMKNRLIADELHISENTVKRHLQSIYSKTGTHERLELAVLSLNLENKAA